MTVHFHWSVREKVQLDVPGMRDGWSVGVVLG